MNTNDNTKDFTSQEILSNPENTPSNTNQEIKLPNARSSTMLHELKDPKYPKEKNPSKIFFNCISSLFYQGYSDDEIIAILNAKRTKMHDFIEKEYGESTDQEILRCLNKIQSSKNNILTNQNGQRIDAREWLPENYIQFIEKFGYNFTLNDLDDTLEINGKPFTEYDLATISTLLDTHLLKRRSDNAIYKYIQTKANQNKSSPIKRYLKNTSHAEGSISKLASYFHTSDTTMFKIYIKKFFVGAVDRAFTGAQNPMLTLDGPQGVGKSFFARWACPLDRYYHASPIKPEEREHLFMLGNKFFWEVPELGGTLKKAEQNALKDFLTLEKAEYYKKFSNTLISKPALANFIGTVNNVTGFLNDASGSRRFHIITVNDINRNYSTEIDINDVWGEAYALWKDGFDHSLTEEEAGARDTINEAYFYQRNIDEILDELVEITGDKNDKIGSRHIKSIVKNELNGKFGNKESSEITEWFKRQGITISKTSFKGQRLWGYSGAHLVQPN